MQNINQWTPSKFRHVGGRWRASPDAAEVGVSSRLMADIIAGVYGEKLPLHARGALLDLGCGKVPFYGAYKDLVASATCVDWENTLHKNPYLDRTCDLTQPLPFASASYDTVLLSDVLEHIPNPELLCAEIARLLAPDGKLIMNVPFYYWLHEEPHDYGRYTEFALRRFMGTAGLQVVELFPVGGAPEVVADILSKCLTRLPRGGQALARAVNIIAGGFLKTRFGRKASAATARQFPFGYFMVAQKQPG